jgi:ElaB/YqjD/DUF883 family membrane-anchored ribosome-binding protein
MTEAAEKDPGKARERLEERAERVRARLIDDVDELNARAEHVAERLEAIKATVKEHPVVVAGVATGAVIALGFVLSARRKRHRRELRRDALLGAAARLLGPTYVVEPPERRSGVISDSLKQAGVALLGALGRELGRQVLTTLAAHAGDAYQAEARSPG